MPDFVRFQTRVILDLYGVPFHAMVVVGSEHDFSIKSASAYCVVDTVGLKAISFISIRMTRPHLEIYLVRISLQKT